MFAPPTGLPGSENHDRWWQSIADANWRHPEGPLSSIKNRAQHPVVHLADADADADAQSHTSWAGKQLPLDQEWDRAAWGGREGYEFAWGDALHPGGIPVANGYGLFDLSGNVRECTCSWYGPHG